MSKLAILYINYDDANDGDEDADNQENVTQCNNYFMII